MKHPIILEGKAFDWDGEDTKACQQNVVDDDRNVNWYAAMGADPGIMQCSSCKEYLWREGEKVRCPHCGHEWRVE